jgi:3',5'-cyclic AMP phosphodiesterase CpdA
MIRLVHFSDVHLTAKPLGWRRSDYLTKRLPGWINLAWFGRAHRFRHAPEVLSALAQELKARPPDRIIFSGDATALGFEVELARVAAILGLNQDQHLPGLAVPGNHDYYTPAVAGSGLFERYFAPWQKGEQLDGAVYPFAQRVGSVWLIGVNSCTGNRWFWDAAGSVDGPQLDRLARLLDGLPPGPRILVTHYPLCLPDGKPERRHHGLRNLADLLAVAQRGRICLWLHGHQHRPYCLTDPAQVPMPIICTGSATQTGLWSHHEYTLEDGRFQALRRTYDPQTKSFRQAESFAIQLDPGARLSP